MRCCRCGFEFCYGCGGRWGGHTHSSCREMWWKRSGMQETVFEYLSSFELRHSVRCDGSNLGCKKLFFSIYRLSGLTDESEAKCLQTHSRMCFAMATGSHTSVMVWNQFSDSAVCVWLVYELRELVMFCWMSGRFWIWLLSPECCSKLLTSNQLNLGSL